MQIIQTNSQERIYLSVYSDGDLTQADSLPTVSIYDADNNQTAISGYLDITATDENNEGLYSILLKPNITNLKRVLEVVWTYDLDGSEAIQTDFYSVETAYASVGEITDFLGFGLEPSDLNYYDPKAIESAEKFARTIVDGYTGQKFSTYYGSQEQYGKGSDALYLTEKMLTIDKVWENDILYLDKTADPVLNGFGFNLELSPTGKILRIINAGWDVRYDNQVDPNVLYYGRFRDNSRYKIQGQIGYKYVPEDIKIATMLLVNDILSNDYNWRNKYLKKVDLSEISFEMAGGAFNGTGNVAVDNILDQYRNVNIVVI